MAVLILTFLIHFFGTAVLSVRLVGVRTGKMAASYAVYNIIFLAMRFLTTFQAPLLTHTVETSILNRTGPDYWLFINLCIVSFSGSILGGLFIPTLHRFMHDAVEKAYKNNSLVRLFKSVFSLSIYCKFYRSLTIPKASNFNQLREFKKMPVNIIIMNVVIGSLTTISVLSCLYAGYLEPDLRTTSLSLNGVIIGLSTILVMILVEPHLGITADKVVNGEYSEVYFRKYLFFVVLARITGTGMAIALLIPLAYIVVFLARLL
ncbi:DUF2837 family protein [Leadbetterella sp. DM7]|uniref:lipid II flippase family protein n=1 Tax=Leadbetterella sp. DM7 TaxID=3235085 RepID=UPI00349EEF0F